MQIFLLLPIGAALGVLASFPVARALQIRLGEADLQQYAQRILHVEELTAQETASAVDAIAGDKLPFCSDADIAAMRDFVFKAAFVRDIGRVKDGDLYCTSIQGRLPQPVAVSAADLTVGQEQIRRNLPVSLISPDSEGIIVYDRGISVVLNRSTVESLDNGSRLSTGLIYDRAHGRVLQLYGHDTPLSGAEVLAQRLIVRGDTAYVPACSTAEVVCVVAAEPRRAMLQRNRTDFAGFLVDGMLLGSTVMAIVLLFIFRQRSLERRLRRAIGRSQITCVYQPIVDLTTGACVGAETLARWVSEPGEMIPPDVFARVADQKGFVGELTRLVFRRTLKELSPLLHDGNFRAAINIAAADLTDPGFLAFVKKALAQAGASPRSIAFELTEHSTADMHAIKEAIARIRHAGFAVYIDDFGTGYSSLAYLQELQVDAIKVDQAFTRTIGTEAVTASVLPQILDIADTLGLMVIVEGIERPEQADYFRIKRDGILGQGWLFGRPATAAEFKASLAAHPAAKDAPRPAAAIST